MNDSRPYPTFSLSLGPDKLPALYAELQRALNTWEPLPEWAERRIGPGLDGYAYERAQLCTRDGRRIGNAVVIRAFGGNYTVLTDMGTEMTLRRHELCELFHPPKYVMKPEVAGAWLSRDEPPESPAKAVRGEVPGGNLPDWPDWPEDLKTFETRAAYQRGVADGRIGWQRVEGLFAKR